MSKLPALTSSVRLPTVIDGDRALARTAWASIRASASPPMGEIDEKSASGWIIDLWKRTSPGMEDREWLQDDLQNGLREGHLDLACYAVRLAMTGDELCHAALLRVGREILTRLSQGRELAAGHLQVVAYLQNAGPEPQRGRGRHWRDDLVRDVRICLCIEAVRCKFGVKAWRNRAGRRDKSKRNPSATSLVVDALGAHINLTERSVEEHIWNGPIGKRLRERGLIQ
jgi:hypothetical protein